MSSASHPTDDLEQAWKPLDLGWARLVPEWAKLSPPIAISLDAAPQYGFAAISSPLPGAGSWEVRLRLGPTAGEMRLVTCDPHGQRREPRTDLFPQGAAGTVLASIDVPADFSDMCLVIQKRDDGPGGVVIEGVDIRPAKGSRGL
jgi:hypothetical protein